MCQAGRADNKYIARSGSEKRMGKTEPVIIIGAGIGGLAAALALKRVGIEARIFERVATLDEGGAGLTLWANAVKALRKLGLEELTTSAFNLADGHIYSWRGAQLTSFSAQQLQRRFGATNLAIHRADLQAALLTAVGPERLTLGNRCCAFEQDESGVTVRLADGQQVRGCALIGADGLHSMVRAQLFGEERLRYAGYTAWRGVTTPPAVEMRVGEYWGRGARFGLVPLTGGHYYWFATRNARAGEPEHRAGRKHEVLSYFAHWYASIPAIIEATPQDAILRNDIYDRPPRTHWTQGRVTLLGDAAHPMTPNLGQGACQALEDALVLAHCLEQTANINVALQLYQARRIPRTTRIVNHSWTLGRIGQWQNPLACKLRDRTLKWLPSSLQIASFEDAVGHEV
jgi:2-polyprenyl-6-methoxyphenol hydroxylase-like FAD-dependent oxidoreductase